jgi:DNA-binding MarR family transcriptional regulator
VRALEQRLAKNGIPIGTWYFLRVLWEEDGLSQAELSERVGIVGPATVNAITRMVRDGLAVREPDPSDKRKVRVCLTPKAQRLKAKLLPLAKEMVDLAVAGIPAEEVELLKSNLRRMMLNLGRFIPATYLSEVKAIENRNNH